MYVSWCNFQYVTECVGVDCQQCGRFYNGFLNIHLVIRQRKVRRFHQHSLSPSAELNLYYWGLLCIKFNLNLMTKSKMKWILSIYNVILRSIATRQVSTSFFILRTFKLRHKKGKQNITICSIRMFEQNCPRLLKACIYSPAHIFFKYHVCKVMSNNKWC